MKAYCGLAANGGKVVTDTIVFSHSYGNAAFAAAIQHGYCDLDKNSSAWYEVSGPLRGSKAANFAAYICSHNSTLDEALRVAATLVSRGGSCLLGLMLSRIVGRLHCIVADFLPGVHEHAWFIVLADGLLPQ